VVLEPEEKKAIAAVQQMRAVRKDQIVRRREKQEGRAQQRQMRKQKDEDWKDEKRKEERKGHMRIAGIKAKRQAEVDEGVSNKRRKL